MLLIAQPKSASTSLAHTIAKMNNLGCKLGIPRTKNDKECDGFPEIIKYHDNMIRRSPVFLKQVIRGRKIIFKEHILPTKEHLRLLEIFYRKNIVVLLRNSLDSFDSYRRLFKKEKKNFNAIQLKEDIEKFNHIYITWAKNKKNILIVYYRELILNYKPTMKRILKHYDLKPKKIIPLLKLRYTGVGLKRIKK